MATRQSRLGFFAMVVTLWTWWKLLRAAALDEHESPPPAFITAMVKAQGWSTQRVANFYEGLMADAKRDIETYAARARDVEAQIAKARAAAFAEGRRQGVAAERARVVELCEERQSAAN